MWTETRSVYTRSVVSWNGLDRAFTGSVETLGGVGGFWSECMQRFCGLRLNLEFCLCGYF